MSEISGISNNFQDNKTSVRSQAKKSYDEFAKSAFDSYKEFKAQMEADYDNFKNGDSLKSANKKYAEELEQPWKEYEVHEGVKTPVMDKPKTAPVYNSDSPVEGKKDADPLAGIKDVGPIEYKEQEVNTDPQKSAEPVQMKNISRKGVSGGYSLTAGKDGKGFKLIIDMKVAGRGEASKFFVMNDEKGNGLYKGEYGKWTFRGIQHRRLSALQTRMDFASQKISVNNAVYNDLLTKQNSGTDLTDAEKLFMKSHIESLEKYGLGLDDDGNLINTLEE